jgi:hypothetical protein
MEALAKAIGSNVPLKVVTAGGVRRLAFGSGTATYSGSNSSGTTTITHGLGATPIAVLVTSQEVVGWSNATVISPGATTFGVHLKDVDGVARTGTETFYWLAIA